MSFQTAVAQIKSPIKDLVLAASQNGSQLVGNSEKDQSEVRTWIEKVGQGELVQEANLPELNGQLLQRTYTVSNYLSAADVALYGALHPIVSKQDSARYYTNSSVTRYFDHIQSLPVVRQAADTLAPQFSPVTFDLSSAPKGERKAEPPKKKKKADPAQAPIDTTPAAASSAVAASPAPADSAASSAPAAKSQKKEKKEKPKKEAAADGGKKKGNTEPAESGEPAPSMIDLRVGHIVDVKKHPDADGLYVEQIDFGEETGPRTVVSGLVNYIPVEDMRDKYLVGVCNLKPANMRGVKSFAMVLCATSKDGKEAGIELVQPPANSKPGDRIYFEGADFESQFGLLNPC
ncbi:hypothetical protein HGRIS_006052 [Hohenbuehelia grisea]|uniref:tRNA-binding domain-containing protein n=1 Tax=Hohenbuehelia grisea TaxID=104357 RepID=A0ABR3K151_9AGAR